VSTRFPFGLFVKSLELPCPARPLVYPRIAPVALAPQAVRPGSDDAERSAAAPAGDEIVGLREYAPGDSPGRVHWRRSLRAQTWLVSERAGEAGGEIECRLDLPARAAASVVEERISRAASEVVAHLEAGLRVGLWTPFERYGADSGFAHRSRLLAHLARLDPRPPPATSPGAREATR
jgi:uncharacterized protein (DUF58 family)